MVVVNNIIVVAQSFGTTCNLFPYGIFMQETFFNVAAANGFCFYFCPCFYHCFKVKYLNITGRIFFWHEYEACCCSLKWKDKSGQRMKWNLLKEKTNFSEKEINYFDDLKKLLIQHYAWKTIPLLYSFFIEEWQESLGIRYLHM